MTNNEQMAELCVRVTRSVVAVIDTMTQRGGFRGEELTTVGQLRDQAIQLRQLAENAQSDASQTTSVGAPPVEGVDGDK
jgi:hypothetical protein